MPNDEAWLVPDPAACAQPAIGKVVVFSGRSNPVVKASELEDGRPSDCHALGVENKIGLTRVLVRDRVIDRGRHDIGVPTRANPTRDDDVATPATAIAHAVPDPRGIDGAVVVGQQNYFVPSLAKAEVECHADTVRATLEPSRACPLEGAHHLLHGPVGARIDDEDLVRSRIAARE
jgi:hypothetical protein